VRCGCGVGTLAVALVGRWLSYLVYF